jgi:hypothetical protein
MTNENFHLPTQGEQAMYTPKCINPYYIHVLYMISHLIIHNVGPKDVQFNRIQR